MRALCRRAAQTNIKANHFFSVIVGSRIYSLRTGCSRTSRRGIQYPKQLTRFLSLDVKNVFLFRFLLGLDLDTGVRFLHVSKNRLNDQTRVPGQVALKAEIILRGHWTHWKWHCFRFKLKLRWLQAVFWNFLRSRTWVRDLFILDTQIADKNQR